MGLAFTYLMTYGGSAVALVNPFVGLLIYVCFAIIRPESLWLCVPRPARHPDLSVDADAAAERGEYLVEDARRE